MAFGQPVGSLSENLIQEMRSLAYIDGYQILFSYWTECFCYVLTAASTSNQQHYLKPSCNSDNMLVECKRLPINAIACSDLVIGKLSNKATLAKEEGDRRKAESPRPIYTSGPRNPYLVHRDALFDTRRLPIMLFAAIVLLFGVTLAQRPPNATICDYYAMNLYGVNTSLSQFQLMQGIVALAFSGGANLPNVSSNITGILNPGTFQGNYVDLQPYFNGSIDSTNLNNQPVGIDWLDGGGVQPLHDFLSGVTPNVTINNSTNE
jgi:hypothetical protein